MPLGPQRFGFGVMKAWEPVCTPYHISTPLYLVAGWDGRRLPAGGAKRRTTNQDKAATCRRSGAVVQIRVREPKSPPPTLPRNALGERPGLAHDARQGE